MGRLSVGCSTSLRGKWVESRGKGQDKEFKVDEVSFVGESDAEVRRRLGGALHTADSGRSLLFCLDKQSYPMPNTKQGIPPPVMRKNAHLRPRKEGPASMLRVRSEMNWAMADHMRVRPLARCVEGAQLTGSAGSMSAARRLRADGDAGHHLLGL